MFISIYHINISISNISSIVFISIYCNHGILLFISIYHIHPYPNMLFFVGWSNDPARALTSQVIHSSSLCSVGDFGINMWESQTWTIPNHTQNVNCVCLCVCSVFQNQKLNLWLGETVKPKSCTVNCKQNMMSKCMVVSLRAQNSEIIGKIYVGVQLYGTDKYLCEKKIYVRMYVHTYIYTYNHHTYSTVGVYVSQCRIHESNEFRRNCFWMVEWG